MVKACGQRLKKTALRNLQSYALTKNPFYYEQYQENHRVPLGDRQARIELSKPDFDPEIVRKGFLQGRIHEDDIDGLIKIIRRFHSVPHLKRAIEVWTEADLLIDEFTAVADKLHVAIQNNASTKTIQEHLTKIYDVDTKLTIIEDRFSYILGEGSRWLERVLMMVLIFTIVIVEGSGLFLTFKFSQNLNRSLSELNYVTQEIGRRNFGAKAPVRSKDELGQLALAINKMSDDLKNSLGQKNKALSDSHLKTIFLANMSHEIRTPVGIILGFADLLKDNNISNTDREHYISTINKTSHNLLRIINDILDISRVESGYIEISSHSFNFPNFIQNLSSLLEIKAIENKNSLVFKAKGQIPQEITTDETRLHQILLNLINNALKFTHNGTVEISYWIENKALHFEVTDTGAGIDNEGKEKLFRLFSQVDDASTRKYGGSGLGLVLSKRLAALMGGDVYLKSSEPGKGSTFAVRVELKDSSEKQSTSNKSNAQTTNLEAILNKNILIVDDSVDNQLLLKIHLRKIKANVYLAGNGQEGVSKALEHDPDIILMDIQMPIKDGYVATQELRKKGFKKPIIALTANAMIEDRNRCIEAGCNDYLSKPIEVNNLFAVLSKYLKA